MKTFAGTITILLAGLSVSQVEAQQTSTDSLLQRIFNSAELLPDRVPQYRWLGEGSEYTALEASAAQPDAFDIVRYDAATGRRETLVTAAQLTPAGQTRPLVVESYTWSNDGSKLLIFTNSERVWRDNTRGDYWVLDRRANRLHKLGGTDARASSLMFAKFAPDGSSVAYVREGDLYNEQLQDGRIIRLTNDGSRTRVNGTTDWVYEEEFFLRDAFRFSPDGTKIVYWQFDMTGVRDFLLINNTDSLYSYTIPVQYPKAGTTNSAVRAGVVSATGGETTWLQLPGDPRDDYLPWMEWAANSNELILQRMNRPQNANRVMLADAATGSVREIFTERDSAWLDVVDDVRWVDRGSRFLWSSERDGWRQLYLISRDGRDVKLITPGEYDVIDVRAVDEAGGYVYFDASPENGTQRYLYRVRLSGGPPERVSPGSQSGTHVYDMSPNAKFAFHTFSTFDSPPVVDLVELPRHRTVRIVTNNNRLRGAAAGLMSRPAEFFRVPVGEGVELDGWMIFPRDFDPARKYPLLMHVYTEPWSQTVRDAWFGSQMFWHRMLADQGYIVASVDNRGTPSPRGRAWRKVVYRKIGVISSREQAEAVRQLTRKRSYLDSARVGVWGWSGGGSATLNAMFRYPDVYRVGMSVAPVPDIRLYDTIYQERYMGLPQQNAGDYSASSPITFAEGLRGDLLLVHGTADDNVHIQGSERLVNRLIELGKDFDYMAYPDRSHCICEGDGTRFHVFRLLTRYLLEHLPPAGRPHS